MSLFLIKTKQKILASQLITIKCLPRFTKIEDEEVLAALAQKAREMY